MGQTTRRLVNFLYLVKHSRFREIANKIKFRFWSNTYSFGLRRDLEARFIPPNAAIPIIIRPLTTEDLPKIFDLKRPGLSKNEIQELVSRLEHLHADIPTCYVATTGAGVPTYMQWLMGSAENAKIQDHFNGTFPLLEEDEALLENALTLPDFRGKGIMAAAMARIAERGREIGARYVITFVEQHNVPSLKGCARAGFTPYVIRHERWMFFTRKLTFSPLPEGASYPFDADNFAPEVTPHVLTTR
ncbi:MAG TPA: GNAT family N-acetyltransferase [Bacteroidota bacterium]